MGFNSDKPGDTLATFNLTLVLFDGDCAACSSIIRFLEKNDKAREIKFITLNSDLGIRLMESLPPVALEADSIIVLLDGRFFIKSDAIIRLAKYLKWPWKMTSIIRILPLSFRDSLYNLMARNRYIFNKKKAKCRLSAYPQATHSR